MTVREAARTSVLSRRWKNMWTFTRDLDFDPPYSLFKIESKWESYDVFSGINREDLALLEQEKYNYSNRINQTLKSHKGTSIDGLRIRFYLDNTHESNIDNWIHFAIQKSAIRLEVELKRMFTNRRNDSYRFPKQVLSLPNIKVLRALRLNYVDVSGPVLEDLLSKCPSLGALSVSDSMTLVGLEVCGALSRKLKFIEIRDCERLEYVEVSAGNLVALTYSGPNISLRVNHAPKLDCMYLGGSYCKFNFPLFCEFSTFFSQLETLVLEYRLDMVQSIPEFPQFRILKHLELILRTTAGNSLLSCISLIKACPLLHRLAVQFEWCSNRHSRRKVEKREGDELQCLKEVKFRRFAGRATDVELAVSLLANSPNLEKIIIDTRDPYDVGPPLELVLDAKRRAAKACSEQLVKKHSPHAKLTVL